ncbi:hypothetical protein THASP1DRAFT_32968 [Thamnocephalis sphaerospora]|uniref:Uncharacterized protein n=1 Tax=Thamnocephalis sphaerospora TaxID=78915 RepID=A0A4P9XHM0_9FUNG|nr:hypothetical protein THASP1DRAFT_32968 [Thamnocephalis sphaerospora]|eukprot:RKP05195.1 hypothetical protein THASP1DRAFT_32968 [Thamnocephalis sphaerospora]
MLADVDNDDDSDTSLDSTVDSYRHEQAYSGGDDGMNERVRSYLFSDGDSSDESDDNNDDGSGCLTGKNSKHHNTAQNPGSTDTWQVEVAGDDGSIDQQSPTESDETAPLIQKNSERRRRTLSGTLSTAAAVALAGFSVSPTLPASPTGRSDDASGALNASDSDGAEPKTGMLPLLDQQRRQSLLEAPSAGLRMVLGPETSAVADTLTRSDGSGYCRRGGAHRWRAAYPKRCWALAIGCFPCGILCCQANRYQRCERCGIMIIA